VTLAASILASSLTFVDGSVVNVPLPALGAGAGGAAVDRQWLSAAAVGATAARLVGGGIGIGANGCSCVE
jgi:hypothetical protein